MINSSEKNKDINSQEANSGKKKGNKLMVVNSKKRKNRNLTIKEKKEIINNKLVHGMSNKNMSKDFFVDVSTVSKIMSHKDKILEIDKYTLNSSKISKIDTKSILLVENILLKWINYYQKFDLPIIDNVLKFKAKHIYNKLKESDNDLPNNFNFSNGWLSRFKLRNNIIQKTLHGENEPINPDIIKKEIESLNLLLSEFDLDCIFNGDESPLYYKMKPNKTKH
jgi:hypothetical protein